MSEIKSRTISIANLDEHKVVAKISTKPYRSLALILLVSGYLATQPDTREYGLIMGAVDLVLLFATKDRILLEATDRYLLIYNEKQNNTCTQVFLSEIVGWKYIYNRKTEELYLKLTDGTEMRVLIVMNPKFKKYLHTQLSDKMIK